MKPKLLLLALAILTIIPESKGQFTFGISPGLRLNSTSFGYRIKDKVVPFIGFQYIHANASYEESGERYDYDIDQIVSYSELEELSGGLYIPNIGVKYFPIQRDKLQAYFSLCISKPILSAKAFYDGEEDEQLMEDIESLSLWGGEFGFGVEYFFDENFSIGGEFGLRYLSLKYAESSERNIYNPDGEEPYATEIKRNLSYNMNPSYSRISLNFYF